MNKNTTSYDGNTRQNGKYSRRTMLQWMGMGISSGLLAACAPAAVPATQEQASSNDGTTGIAEPTSLTLTFWGSESQAKFLLDLSDQYEQENSEVTIERVHIPSSYDEKLLTMIAGGTAPDVQMTLRPTYSSFVERGIALNMQPYLDAIAFDPETYFAVSLEPYQFRGSLYGMPKSVDAWVLFYNKTLFDEAGVEYPTGEWTWDDLVANGQQLTIRDANDRAQQFGFGFAHLEGAKAFDCFVYQAGGSLVDNDREPTTFTLDQPESLAGLQFMADLANVHGIMPSPRERNDMGAVDDLFMSGKIAMRYGEFFSTPQYLGIESFEWDIAEPARGVQQATWLGGACYTVNTATENPDAAVAFTLFLTGPAAGVELAQSLSGIPAVKAMAESPDFLEHAPPPENLHVALDVFAYGVQPPMLPTFPEWNRLILNALDPVWTGEQTAEQAITAIAGEAQALIDQGREMLAEVA